MDNQFVLFSQRRFAPFFWTQFLGALNDNVFKVALLTSITYDTAAWTSLDAGLLNNLIPGLFILPFMLFSAAAGQLADRSEKSRLMRQIKLAEIGIMLVAVLGWMAHNLWLLVAAIAAMGWQSAMFGPVKYAYLPQHLKREELIGGNGVVEMGTFAGILLGQVLGAVLVLLQPWGTELVAAATLMLAILGWLASCRVPLSPAADSSIKVSWNPFSGTLRNLRYSYRNRTLFLALIGNSWFWFYGAIILAQFPLYAKEVLHGDNSVFVLLLMIFSLGVGAGALLCEWLSGRRIEIGLVPLGAIGMSVFGIDLFFASVSHAGTTVVDWQGFAARGGSLRIMVDCLLIGVFGGFYSVPLFAMIQTRCDPKHISRTIAGMNILNALFMVVAALCGMAMLQAGLSIPQVFLATALLNAVVAACVFSLVPEFLLRFLAWLLIHSIHHVRNMDTHRIPEHGAAVLVCNHVSHVDAVAIMAACPRPIRFVMDHRIFRIPLLSWVFRTARAIPIASAREDAALLQKALDDIAHALDNGELVCIFPEGKLAESAEINPFKSGIRSIVERSPVPVIPMALRGLWGSLLSRSPDNPFGRAFRRGPRSELVLVVGQPVSPGDATPEALQRQVASLRGDWK